MRIKISARLRPGVLALLPTLIGCTTISGTPPLDQQLREVLPRQAELRQVPFFPQEENQCGPAALATVLQAQGLPVTPDALSDEVYLPKRRGSLQIELSAAARSRGMVVYPLPPDFTALLNEIGAGNPVLVFQNLGLRWFPQWHYAVVVGYDMASHSLILRSGSKRRHRLPFSTFDRTWQRTGRWALVVLPPERVPASATARVYLEAIHQLDLSGQNRRALIAYRAAARRWPDEPLALMALANAEYAAGNLAIADENLRELIWRHPDNANAWNNLAYVLAERSCAAEARQAIDCARALQPGDANIRQSAEELSVFSAPRGDGCLALPCPIAIIQ